VGHVEQVAVVRMKRQQEVSVSRPGTYIKGTIPRRKQRWPEIFKKTN
jgi:hypothetical protein